MKKSTNDQIYLNKYLKLKEEEAKYLVLQEDATKAVNLAEKVRKCIVGICIFALCLHLILPLLGPIYSLIPILFLSSIVILGPTQMILESRSEKKQKLVANSEINLEDYKNELDAYREESQHLLPLPVERNINEYKQNTTYNKNKENTIKIR